MRLFTMEVTFVWGMGNLKDSFVSFSTTRIKSPQIIILLHVAWT